MNDPSVRLEVQRLKNNRGNLPLHPVPQTPDLANNSIPIKARLKLIQAYITSLEYNYTGEDFFVKKKDRGFRHVTSTAKLIIREALPIQCVDAVFLGAYLTSEMTEVDRFPVCFRSSLDSRVFRHIVLAVRSGSVWGALGLSRRDTLMYKELRYTSFSDLMADFRESYAGSWHRLEQLWVGFPLPHDISSNIPVKWKVMRASVSTDSEWTSAVSDLNRFVSCASSLFERFKSTGKVPDHPVLRSGGLLDGCPGDSNGDGRDGSGTGSGGTCSSPIGNSAGDGGERSPGAPCCWLLPGGRRRRASMPVAAARRKAPPKTPVETAISAKETYLATNINKVRCPSPTTSRKTSDVTTASVTEKGVRVGEKGSGDDMTSREEVIRGEKEEGTIQEDGDATDSLEPRRCRTENGSASTGNSPSNLNSPPRPLRAKSMAEGPRKLATAKRSRKRSNACTSTSCPAAAGATASDNSRITDEETAGASAVDLFPT